PSSVRLFEHACLPAPSPVLPAPHPSCEPPPRPSCVWTPFPAAAAPLPPLAGLVLPPPLWLAVPPLPLLSHVSSGPHRAGPFPLLVSCAVPQAADARSLSGPPVPPSPAPWLDQARAWRLLLRQLRAWPQEPSPPPPVAWPLPPPSHA
ncbi:hypothetical protein Vafri_17398, partial [Volvox africanus]